MQELGFEALDGEPCLLRKGDILILIYVDDCCITAPKKDQIDATKEDLNRTYDLKNIGPLREYLGFEIIRDRPNRKLFLHQTKYTKIMLERFGYHDANVVYTPILSSFKNPYPRPDANAEPEVTRLYQQ